MTAGNAASRGQAEGIAQDAATLYTHEFVSRSLPASAHRLLEIGCGNGLLAARLQADGYSVVALDSSADAVAAAKAAGVDARAACWPDFSDGTFDAVLFTRSLHHVGDLDAAIGAAFACLSAGGRVIVEDFDFDFAKKESIGWFAGLLRVLCAAGVPLQASPLLAGLAGREQAPLDVWRGDHGCHHHSAAAIDAAVKRATPAVSTEAAAYFFRYVAEAVPAGSPLIHAVLAHELELIEQRRLEPLGRRLVAQQHG